MDRPVAMCEGGKIEVGGRRAVKGVCGTKAKERLRARKRSGTGTRSGEAELSGKECADCRPISSDGRWRALGMGDDG